jgi:hypothetical protein
MPGHEQEPLEKGTWFKQLDRLLEALANSDGPPDRHIRRAYHLQCLAPPELRPMMAPPTDEQTFEALLDAGMHDDAVSLLIGAPDADLANAAPETMSGVERFGSLPGNSNSAGLSAQSRLAAWAASLRQSDAETAVELVV